MIAIRTTHFFDKVFKPIPDRLRGWQRQAQRRRFGQRVIKVFELEFRQAAGVKITSRHPFSVLLQNHAVGKTTF